MIIMAEFDRETKKKLHRIWVVIASILMTLSVVLIVVVTTLLALGYSFNGEVIQQTGVLQLHTTPTGATVTVDGKTEFFRSNLSLDLAPGAHQLRLTRDGYDSWEKSVTIHSGYVFRLYYPRLFLLERPTEVVAELPADLEFYSVAPNRKGILYASSNATTWTYTDTSGSDLVTTALDLAPILGEDLVAPATASTPAQFLGEIQSLEWNTDGSRVLAAIARDGRTSWFLLNLKDIQASVNLSETFAMDFERVSIASDSADRLFAFESGNIRSISVGTLELSRVLLDHIESYQNYNTTLAYVQNLDGQRNVGTFEMNDSGGVRIVEIETEIFSTAGNADGTEESEAVAEDWGDQSQVQVAISEYYGDEYLAVVSGKHIRFYGGTFPTYGTAAKISETLPLLDEFTLSFTPTRVEASPDSEYFLFADGSQVATIDTYDNSLTTYTAPSADFAWFDDGMLYATSSGQLVVWDFDGANQRTLAGSVADYPVLNSENDRYVYYVLAGELVRMQVTE